MIKPILIIMAVCALVTSCKKPQSATQNINTPEDSSDIESNNWATLSAYLKITNHSSNISTTEVYRYLQEYDMETRKRYNIDAGLQIPRTILPKSWEDMDIDERMERMPGNRVEDIK